MNYQKLQDTPQSTPLSGVNIQIGQDPSMHTFSTQGSFQDLSGYQQGTAAYPQFNEYPQKGQYQPNGYAGGYGQQHAPTKYVYESKAYKEDYFNKKLENSLIKRTEVTGS